jgi:TPR repeat protein
MKRRILILAIAAGLSLPVAAKLGETPAQIHARYGKPYQTNDDHGDATESFLFKDRPLDVVFVNKVSACEIFYGADGEKMISTEKAQIIASAVTGYGAGVGDWVFSDLTEGHVFMESRAPGFTFALSAGKPGVDVMVGGGQILTVQSQGYLDHFEDLQRRKKAELVASLSGPVAKPPAKVPENLTAEQLAARKAAEEAQRAKVMAPVIAYYQRAAEGGDAEAQLRLGEIYRDGDGVAKDAAKACEWFAKAAAQGNKRAEEALDRLEK